MTHPQTKTRRSALIGAVLAAGSLAVSCVPASSGAPTGGASVADPSGFVFPLERTVPLSDTFGAPRSGGRTHQGQDLMAPKMTRVVAVVSGTITQIRHSNAGNAGNQIRLTGDDGWNYYYIHLNNDTPGTDDGRSRFDQAFVDGLRVGQRVLAGEPIGYVGDSGNAESTAPHLHLEAHAPGVGIVNNFAQLKAAPVAVRDTTASRPFGALDSAGAVAPNTIRVQGWALAAQGEDTVPVTVYLNGNPAGSATANTARADVGVAYGRGGNHGFDVTVGGVVAGTHEVCVVLHNPTAGGGSRTNCALVPVG